jgi:5-formyltetrahydrofolate cyclo-ligase
MTSLAEAKAASRRAAVAERDRAHAAGAGAARIAAGHALQAIGRPHAATAIAAYLPIRSEIDTMPLLHALRGLGLRTCLPVVVAPGQPLQFRAWSPGDAMERDKFGTAFPGRGEPVLPQVLIVPLLAFDGACRRLGYGGGYYDRTLAMLRAGGDVRAIGFAYAAQRVAEVPHDVRDAVLDAVVTERGIVRPE